MAFEQLLYTSCERGLSGYIGFQFNAVSPGADESTRRTVENLTGYRRPPGVLPGAEPVNLCHLAGADEDITAQVVDSGTDPRGRPGNYFAHALVTRSPGDDLGDRHPIELWGSPVWTTAVAAEQALPVVDPPLPAGTLDRVQVASFLAERPDGTELAVRLVTATMDAVAGGRAVVLSGSSAEENALWIAAVSYLLDPALARSISFATYVDRADRGRLHLYGVLAGAGAPALGPGYRVVDLTGAGPLLRDVSPHPTAALVGRAGLTRAAGVWRRARALAVGTERTLDDWYPVLLADELLDGAPTAPSPDDLGRVVDWLSARAGTVASSWGPMLLRVVLGRQEELSTERLRSLVPLTERAAPDLVPVVESGLWRRAWAELAEGRPAPVETRPVTSGGREAIASEVGGLLEQGAPERALTVLRWLVEAKVPIDGRVAAAYARDRLGPQLERLGDRIVEVGSLDPDLRAAFATGLASHLAERRPTVAARLLGGPVGGLLDGSDLSAHPRLHEAILLQEVSRGRLSELGAFTEIGEIRGALPFDDDELLTALWRERVWNSAELAAFAPKLPADRCEAIRWMPRLAPPDLGAAGDSAVRRWLTDVAAMATSPAVGSLAKPDKAGVVAYGAFATTFAAAARAAGAGRPAVLWVAELDNALGTLPAAARRPLTMQVARLVVQNVREPAAALAAASTPLFEAYLAVVSDILAARKHTQAATVVATAAALRGTPRHRVLADEVIGAELSAWPGKDLFSLRHLLGRTEEHRPLRATTADSGRGGRSWLRLPGRRAASALPEYLDDVLKRARDQAPAPKDT